MKPEHRKKVIDILTIGSLIVGMGTAVMGVMPSSSEATETTQSQIYRLEAEVADLREELAYRDEILYRLATQDRDGALAVYEAVIANRPQQALTASAGVSDYELPTYQEFKSMLANHEYPRLWFYYHYHIISLTFFLSFLVFGVFSIRERFRG